MPAGLKLLGVEYDRVPWVSLTFMAKRGAETDPPGKAGVADWTAEFLTLGTARRSQWQLAEDIESLGAELHARGDWDATYISLEGLAEDFPVLMATLAEVVQTPGFPEDEFPLLKSAAGPSWPSCWTIPGKWPPAASCACFSEIRPMAMRCRESPRAWKTWVLRILPSHYRREFTPQRRHPGGGGHGALGPGGRRGPPALGRLAGGGPASPAYTTRPARDCAPRASISWTGRT